MADIEPPSFSLGLDLDFEPEPELEPQRKPPNSPPHQRGGEDNNRNEEDLFQLRVSDSDLDDPPPTRFRRLRKSGSKPISNATQLPTSSVVTSDDDEEEEDDIQDFSSDELPTTAHPSVAPAPQHHSLCSSSKLPLSGCGILERQLETKVANKKRKQDSSCPSTSLDGSKAKSKLMDLTTSPLRRFRLLDSDSDFDGLSKNLHTGKHVKGLRFPSQNEQDKSSQRCNQSACEKKINSSATTSLQKQDLWKDFHADKSPAIQTPAFDEFCQEYFSASKERKQPSGFVHEPSSSGLGKNVTRKTTQSQNVGSDDPPSHRYFFHDDLRIQILVRNRLRHFLPLGASGDEINKSFNASPIDYMSQFGHGDGAKRQTCSQLNSGKSSGRGGKRTKKSVLKETANASDGWVNPKETVSCPTDAGRRRVHADGQAAGHWFTAENGKKVYVTKAGKELTGRQAYRSYKKESGRGFKRGKKKAVSKKKK